MSVRALESWQQFVLDHGWRAVGPHVAHALGRTPAEIEGVRRTGACRRLDERKEFAALFALWHGRPPEDAEWPKPRKAGMHRTYEWLLPEDTFLATLVGQMGLPEIRNAICARLREVTGDRRATRSKAAVQTRINKIGLQVSDVLGGITISDAAAEIGSLCTVQQAVAREYIRARRVGRLLVIPYDEWERWKGTRTFPPKGYVKLSSIREPLGISSDSKLPEFATFIPTAVRCNPYGNGPNTQYGTWYIAANVARKLVRDRHAGRPMPWHGKPLMTNLRVTFKLWEKRRHPKECPTCQQIWGPEGAPATFEDYCLRYAELDHGAKRHLTMKWTPGLTITEVAQHTKQPISRVRLAVANKVLPHIVLGRRQYVSRKDATLWAAHRAPTGEGRFAWISLDTAAKRYLFTTRELKRLIAKAEIESREGTQGAQRGITYVRPQQCAQRRDQLGFTEKEAAARLHITIPRLRQLLEGVNWRGAPRIPFVTLQAVKKRLESRAGFDLNEAAAELAMPVSWIEQQITAGLVRVS
jgi:hypothetical protein